MKALDAERKKALKADQARKAAEKQLAELTGVKETLDAMKAALVGTDGADTKPEEAVKAVTEKVDALQLSSWSSESPGSTESVPTKTLSCSRA